MDEPIAQSQIRVHRTLVWQVLLLPYPALALVSTMIAVTAVLAPGDWVPIVGLSWIIATVVLACVLLVAARPLAPLRERSHLVGRLGWLIRFMLAAVLLCLSAFVGAIAGAQVRMDPSGLQFGQVGTLLRSVLSIAMGGGLFLFLSWLAVDVWRLGPERRLESFCRAMNYAARPWPMPRPNRFVRSWIMALTSPLWLSVALVGSGLWAASALFQQSGLTFA